MLMNAESTLDLCGISFLGTSWHDLIYVGQLITSWHDLISTGQLVFVIEEMSFDIS